MNFECFECGHLADHAHHVVPRAVGGTRTIPLCQLCHAKVHGYSHSWSVKEGLARARAEGKKLGRPKAKAILYQPEFEGLSLRGIARFLGISHSSVKRRYDRTI